MGPWVQGLFGTHSSFTPIMAEQKCVCGHIWGDPVPTNCRVLKADGHFTVARTLYYPYHKLWVPGSKGYLVHIAHLHPLWQIRNAYVAMFGVTLSPQTAASLSGHFTVARTLYYPYHKLWVPGSKGYLVHIAHLHPLWQIRNAYVAMFGVTLSPQTAASLRRMVILR